MMPAQPHAPTQTSSSSSAANLNPKLEISSYYDSLIRQIDIYTESSLEKLNGNHSDQVFTTITSLGPYAYDPDSSSNPNNNKQDNKKLSIDDLLEPESVEDIWEYSPFRPTPIETRNIDYGKHFRALDTHARSIQVREYLNRVRGELIDEVIKIQRDTLAYYENAKDELKIHVASTSELQSVEDKRDRMQSLVFAQNFAFILNIDKFEQCNESDDLNSPFKLYLVVLDFYLNRNEREFLALYLNKWTNLKIEENLDLSNIEHRLETKAVVNQEFLLAHLLEKYLIGLFGCRRPINRIIRIDRKTLLSSTKTIQIEISEIRAVDVHLDRVDPLFQTKYDFSNIKFFEFTLGMYASGGCIASRITECDVNIHSVKLLTALESLEIDCRHKEQLKAKFSPTFFTTLSDQLTLLRLKNCDYAQVPSDAFASLRNLHALELASSFNCTHIDLDVMKSSTHLKWLRLASYELSDFPAFRHLIPSVIFLELIALYGWNDDPSKPAASKLKRLQEFRPHERLIALDLQIDEPGFDLAWFARFSRLKFLRIHLRDLQTIELPDQMNSLKSLSLGNNQLESVGGAGCSNLVDLKFLDLSSNRLKLDRSEVFKFKKLVKLDVNNNSLEVIHKEAFRGLDNLESLDVSYNQPKDFDPEMFVFLPNLKHLKMDNIGLDFDKMKFAHLTRLKSLSMQFNNTPESKLPHGCFESLGELELLDLSYCGLEMVDRGVFTGLGKLRELVMIGNRLEKIPSQDTFGDMPSLAKIDLRYNPFEAFNKNEARIKFEPINLILE